jgi:hypothetical protein
VRRDQRWARGGSRSGDERQYLRLPLDLGRRFEKTLDGDPKIGAFKIKVRIVRPLAGSFVDQFVRRERERLSGTDVQRQSEFARSARDFSIHPGAARSSLYPRCWKRADKKIVRVAQALASRRSGCEKSRPVLPIVSSRRFCGEMELRLSPSWVRWRVSRIFAGPGRGNYTGGRPQGSASQESRRAALTAGD